ncbi:odorant receptor 45a-like isoform 2-T2 [Cochliomyia hominivorax]
MVVKRYFFVQELMFALCGIDTKATKFEKIIKRPLLCYVPLIFAIAHVMAIIHYAYVNRHDYVEVTDSLALSCQLLLAIWKMIIFLCKRKEFTDMINLVHSLNFKAGEKELLKIRLENSKDVKFCTGYLLTVIIAAILAFATPILEAIYFYVTTGMLVLRVPYKGSYYIPHSELPGYSLVYMWNFISIYHLLGITMALDTLFTWMVSNISAQFHFLCFCFKEAGKEGHLTTKGNVKDLKAFSKLIKSCIESHNLVLNLAEQLNDVYVFRLSRPSESMMVAAYQGVFLLTVAMQLMLYCYNGQRIRDESLQVAPEIYFAFDWSHLAKPSKKLLFLPMMRSQKNSQLKGIFFTLDLSLFLWVFKTAGSLIAALKTLEENQ